MRTDVGEEIFIILFLVFLAWMWLGGMRAKEAAVPVARRACERHGQQFLDETVVLQRILPARDRDGRVRLRRIYRFEFTDDGDTRRGGTVEVLGRRVAALNLDLGPFTLHEMDGGGDG